MSIMFGVWFVAFLCARSHSLSRRWFELLFLLLSKEKIATKKAPEILEGTEKDTIFSDLLFR